MSTKESPGQNDPSKQYYTPDGKYLITPMAGGYQLRASLTKLGPPEELLIEMVRPDNSIAWAVDAEFTRSQNDQVTA